MTFSLAQLELSPFKLTCSHEIQVQSVSYSLQLLQTRLFPSESSRFNKQPKAVRTQRACTMLEV